MSHQQWDKIADLSNPVLAVAIIVLAILWLKNAAAPFLMRNGLAFILAQQISKYVQKHGSWGQHFPSTHYAVALVLSVTFVFLRPKLWPVALVYLLAYGELMLYQHYHTPAEMLGAFFAVPLAVLFNWKFGTKNNSVKTGLSSS